MPPVQVDASRTNRSLTAAAAGPSRRPELEADPVLLGWRRLIDTCIAGAKRTKDGLPTYLAIMDRSWFEERTSETDREHWASSFEAACHWLDEEVEPYRKRIIAEIDDVWSMAAVRHAANETYRRRAQVLTCAGRPTRIGRQFAMGLVSLEDYEEIAGVVHPDPPARKPKRSMALPFAAEAVSEGQPLKIRIARRTTKSLPRSEGRSEERRSLPASG